MRQQGFLLLLLFMIPEQLFSQSGEYEYFITANANLYVPFNDAEKGMYPILWFDKKADPKILIGGFGAGFCAFKPFRDKVLLKAQGNISRHTYWNGPFDLRSENNEPLGDYIFTTSDYTLGLSATAHYFFSQKFSIGTGLGAQVMLVSISRLPDVFVEKRNIVNRYNKPFMPVLPLEFSLKSKRKLYTIRYEHALLNRMRKDLAKNKTSNFGLLTFEIGFRIGKSD